MTERTTPGADGTKNWLRRILSKLDVRANHGDVIAGEVGEGARGVVIGKNIVQIGTLKVPLLPLLLVPLILIGGFAAAFFAIRGPTRMDGSFNVAVAEFGQEQLSGRVVSSREGELLSKWVYESLVGQKEAARNSNSVDPDIISSLESLEIWQDTLPITEKGTRIGVVKNEVDAPELANRLGAQVLIYGNIDPQGNFTPRFYVSPLVHSGTDQIIGHYSLGNTPVPINSTALDFAINKVADRTDPLLWLAVGLRQEQLGFAPEALDAFGRAVNAVEDQEGADIIYYFSGDAALFLAQQQTGFNEDLASRSEDAFTEALQINPQSFRAHVGIAAVNLYRAKNEHHLNLEASKPFLDKAIQESQLALQLTSSSPDQELKVLATLALAQTQYFLGAANYQVRRFEEAEAAFNQAIQMLEGISPELAGGSAPRITGLVYQTMGTVYKQMAQIYEITGENEQSLDFYRQARDAYALCIEQGKAGVFDEILTGTIIRKFCVPQDAESAKAMQLLQGGQ